MSEEIWNTDFSQITVHDYAWAKTLPGLAFNLLKVMGITSLEDLRRAIKSGELKVGHYRDRRIMGFGRKTYHQYCELVDFPDVFQAKEKNQLEVRLQAAIKLLEANGYDVTLKV